MIYDLKKQKWIEQRRPKYYYPEDRNFYAGVVWALMAFMMGLVVATVLVLNGVI